MGLELTAVSSLHGPETLGHLRLVGRELAGVDVQVSNQADVVGVQRVVGALGGHEAAVERDQARVHRGLKHSQA